MAANRTRVVAKGLLRLDTPVEDRREEFGLWVKREDLACRPPGPPFSKSRGVYAHVLSRPEDTVGVLDTYHSQAGHAVAAVCKVLGKRCVNYYPEFKHEPGHREAQDRSSALGAELVGLQAGRSAVLFHQAKKHLKEKMGGGYFMPNALKLPESITETAREVPDRPFDHIIIPSSSGTIAAGVVKGVMEKGFTKTNFVVHMGYSRSVAEMSSYILKSSGHSAAKLEMVDEGYGYKDYAGDAYPPPWPCNRYYDLKALRWWQWVTDRGEVAKKYPGEVLFWNIG